MTLEGLKCGLRSGFRKGKPKEMKLEEQLFAALLQILKCQ
jgi:hypothetical protein